MMTSPDHGSPLVRPRARTIKTLVPVSTWLPAYRWATFPTDLAAGVALAALLIPESMGYATVAGVPPELGLYAALAAVVAYAVVGGASALVVGPASAVAALSASIVAEFGPDVDPVVLTSALALTSGALLVVAGALRLGWIVNFISRPVLIAFITGLTTSIIAGQLDGLLGVEADGESAVARVVDTIRQVGDWHGPSVAIGVGALLVMLALERVAPKVPGAIVVVVAGILLVAVGEVGVEVVGEIPQGLPSVAVPDLSGTRWLELAAGGAALLLVGFSEGYAATTAVAERTGEDVDPDQELIGTGVANVASGLVGGIAVSGSMSKSEAAQAAGSHSQFANLVAGAVVLATLLFLAPVVEDLPEPVLAAVVIAAVIRAADPRRVLALWPVNRLDFVAGSATYVLVLVWETLPALIVGVALSLVFLVRRASFPDVVELRRQDDGSFARVDGDETVQLDAAERVVVLRLEAPLVYTNAARLERAAATLLEVSPAAERLVLDAEMFADLDATGAETLERLDDDLAERGIELRIARAHRRARTQIDRSGLSERFAGRMDPTVREAVERP